MYQTHFGLTQEPFSLVPSPKFLFLSERHKEAIAHIKAGIQAGGGFAMLTGEVGTGKTMVCKSVLDDLAENTQVALIVNPKLSEQDLLLSICEQFGCAIDSTRPAIDQLRQTLEVYYQQGKQPLLVVDEAHHLSVVALEQLRLLTNFELGEHKLLKVWLIGQPELQQRLQTLELRQLAQRITGRYHLLPLQAQEVDAYIQHRLTLAGARAPIFAKGCSAQIARATRVPRLINLIADKALQLAYMAGDTQVKKGVAGNAIAAIMEHQYQQAPIKTANKSLVAVSVAAALLIGAWGLSQVEWTQFSGGEVALQTPIVEPQNASIDRQPEPAVSTPIAAVEPVVDVVVDTPETPQPQQTSLTQWLNPTNTTSHSKVGAMQSLFELWGYQASIMASSCEQVPLPFRCVVQQGSLEQIITTNRPVVLELTQDGIVHYATLYAAFDGKLDLLFADSRVRIDQAWLSQHWQGRYIEIWYSQLQAPLKLGQVSEQIQLLEDQVSLALDEPTRLNDRFDTTLENKVKAFQLWKGLDVDGVVGNQTIKALDSSANLSAPKLNQRPVDAAIDMDEQALSLMLPSREALKNLSVFDSSSAKVTAQQSLANETPVVEASVDDNGKLNLNNPSSAEFDLSSLNLDELDPDIARMVSKAIENQPEQNATQPTTAERGPSVVKIEDVATRMSRRLPALDFQTHMYASDPSKRWIKVNGQELQQGELMQEGAKVVEIAPRYVVLEYQGERIEFPALFEWQ